uniref:ABC transporter domain-containing protein n=1 Tax=Kalanchoe fedtschenkoi TaxID=63787 RepID=A0A7N0UE45_KALFE
MASIVPGNTSPEIRGPWSYFNRTYATATELQPSTMASPNPTLGQLLKRVGDARISQDTENKTMEHRVLEMRDTHQHDQDDDDDDDDDNHQQVPFILSFNNLTYSVKLRHKLDFQSLRRRRTNPDNTKTLLDGISGEARDGEILAVLGASGSGKSTLIDALANRIAKESLKGTVKLNNESLDSRLFKVISAYVMQDDLLFPMLTVEETLMFAAEFRLPRSLSKSKKRARVQALIDQLGIRSAATTVIGDEGHRGVSGGERRRVSIGTDIIHDPILLFLDEPTSGLDSTSAFMVVKVLQRIAQSGSVVIMSIHQPSSRILGLLDRLIFLSRGQTVYSGRPGNLAAYFSEFGYPIPEPENRTEFALDLIREMEESPGGTRSLVEFHKRWEHKHARSRDRNRNIDSELSLKEAISASISKGKLVSGAGNNGGSMVPTFANPVWIEMGVLSKRSILNSKRMPELFGIRLGAVVVTGFILATMFWQLDRTPKGVVERLGFIAFAMSTTFYTCADALPVFLHERYIFMRETAHNAYRRSSYVLSHSLVALPALLFLSFTFSAITFWSVGLAGGFSGFMFYFLIILASFWAGSSFVTFLSGVVSHVMIGFTVVVAILAYFLLFSGFFITRERIPDYWIWFHYLSLVKYPYEAVLQNEFGDPRKCFVRGVQIFDNTPLGKVPDAIKVKLLENMGQTLGFPLTSSTCLTKGVDLLKQQGVTQLSKWGCFWVTVAWGFLFRLLFYVSLMFGSKNKRS